jgi:hypothetical protein
MKDEKDGEGFSPKGIWPLAQGWHEVPTLGTMSQRDSTPTELCPGSESITATQRRWR